MQHDVFEKPVRVFVGLGMPRDIDTVFQAYAFLSESPRDKRKPDHVAARNACLAAMNGIGDAEAARRAFAAYAASVGILAAEMDECLAAPSVEAPEIRLAS